ncbi:hypothetical protein CEXT_799781 [Caerostris extrusa]|uniref:Uncharacterized protein n=1 Tax=Caerostris extrusa TaxID=172846 RepID=A0AAV4PXH6_CAEEX|nr:hypothetical protein CEXT_799781 [Caerostris extrusa]
MAIWNCEFCNAYVTDFEVHYCRNFGNQQRQSSATIPRSTSADLVQNIDSRSVLPMKYDAEPPVTGQINSSAQQSVLPSIHQRKGCEDAATAEIPSPYGNANQKQYHPETSDFLFPNMAHGEEKPSKSTPLTVADQNNPMHVAEPCFLPGFQETFGQRDTLMDQIVQRPSASSQMECSVTFHTDGTSSHFISYFNESDNASTNRISEHYETSSGIPILADQNAQSNLMDPISPTDAIGPIHSNNRPKEVLLKDHLEPRDRSRSHNKLFFPTYIKESAVKRLQLLKKPSPYGNANQNQCDPETSDFLFPNMPHGQENPSKSTPFTVANKHNPMPVA